MNARITRESGKDPVYARDVQDDTARRAAQAEAEANRVRAAIQA